MLIRVRATCETSLPTRSADSAKERYTFAMLENGPPGNGTAAGLRFAHYPQQAYVNLSDVSLDEEQTQHQTRHDGEEIDGWHHAIELMDQETSRKMIAYATTAKKIRNVLNSNTGLSPRTRARAQHWHRTITRWQRWSVCSCGGGESDHKPADEPAHGVTYIAHTVLQLHRACASWQHWQRRTGHAHRDLSGRPRLPAVEGLEARRHCAHSKAWRQPQGRCDDFGEMMTGDAVTFVVLYHPVVR